MSRKDADTETDIGEDRGETIGLMEPMMIAEEAPQRTALTDLAIDLAARSTGFRRSLPDGVTRALADLVRAMNCSYGNLIEGHDKHPVDIERALRSDYSKDAEKRNLQIEARAHIAVQRWIDDGGLDGRAVSPDGISETHRRFGELLTEELLSVTNPDTGESIIMVPGEWRLRDVKVGRHIPISPGAVPRFLKRFEQAYSTGGKTAAILAAAAAHHRLLWIHPFLDGNGRVARLMSHAMLREILDTGGIWSIARGLARGVKEYRTRLAACDEPRRVDLDGRATLRPDALISLTRFFLETCIDQVKFMEELVQPERLRDRMLTWCEEEIRGGRLPQKSGRVLEAVMFRGELPRGDVAALLGATDRHARRITSALLEREVIASDGTRAPLRLNFPAALAPRWMPGLFPERI